MAIGINESNTNDSGTASDTSGANLDTVGSGASDSQPIDPANFAKRGRGRHPGNCDCEKCSAKRANGTGSVNSGERGSGNRKSGATAAELDINGFALQLQGVHKLAVLFTKNDIWNISDDEAKKLAQAVKGVLKHHNIPVSPVVLAYLQLGGVSLAIYGPRIGIMMAVKKMQDAQAKKDAEIMGSTSTTTMMAVDPTTTIQ